MITKVSESVLPLLLFHNDPFLKQTQYLFKELFIRQMAKLCAELKLT